MAGVSDFRELAAWQRAEELRDLAYAICRRPRIARDIKFRGQLHDAVSKAPRQIAEGFGRYRHREFANYVRMAKGSECEVLDLFIDAKKQGYIGDAEYTRCEICARRAIAAAAGLIRYLESSPDIN